MRMSILSALRLTRAPGSAFVVMGLYWGVFAAHVPVFRDRLGVDDAVFGSLLLGSSLGLLTTMWLAPRFDQKLGRAALPVAAALLALAWIAPALAATPLAFAIGMVGVGMASGVCDVVRASATWDARVSQIEAQSGRSLMNANHGLFSLAYGCAALASGLTREAGLPILVVFGGMTVVTLVLMPLLWRAPSPEMMPEEGASVTLPLWPVALCGIVVMIAFLSEATVESWSALHIERTLGGGAAQGALGPALLGITMTLGRFGGQALAERLSETAVIRVAALVSAFGAAIAAMAPVPMVAYLGFAITGLGISVIGPMGLALAGRMVAPHQRSQAIARVAVIAFCAFLIAPVLMGGLSEVFGLRLAFGAVAALLLMILPPVLALRRRARALAAVPA
ncbi:LOW QUALITY PROTEIN: major facilitator superfamily (MFS) transporter [Limimaricola cinnabarinus LL-001]|uniref:Major facilitator superfamily (MFS) transporter n=2 Tax=Limimaricola cinnabarinus TaxID=1125964 RepID=U2YZF7_9RHOB|nr:LOW QUALITY PROTEIN: major facilitator superfamily (MFS) transporter [Limimaricola cinnabarinus LL-001]